MVDWAEDALSMLHTVALCYKCFTIVNVPYASCIVALALARGAIHDNNKL